jgi:thiol-disulfide isomerase/thioredoxin
MKHQPPASDLVSRRSVLKGAVLGTLPTLGAAAEPDAFEGRIVWPELHLADGTTLLPAAWANTPAVIVFWEPWCPYCKRHNAHVEDLYQSTLGQKIRIMGATSEMDIAKVRRYLQANQFHFSVAMVGAEFRAQFTTRRVIPMTCLVSAEGRLLQAIPGEMANADVLSLATPLLKSSIGNAKNNGKL